MIRAIAKLVVSVLIASDIAPGEEARTQDPDSTAYAKLLLAGIPVGSVVEVFQMQKGSRKITGKLISISEDSLEVEQVKSGKVLRQKIAFSELKLVKRHGMSNKAKALIAVGVGAAGVAALLATLAIGMAGGMR